jgi:hypothetical protein
MDDDDLIDTIIGLIYDYTNGDEDTRSGYAMCSLIIAAVRAHDNKHKVRAEPLYDPNEVF